MTKSTWVTIRGQASAELATPGLDHVGWHVPSMGEALSFCREIGYSLVWEHGPFKYSAGRWTEEESHRQETSGQRHHVGHVDGARLRLALMRIGNGPNLELIEIAYPDGAGGWNSHFEHRHAAHSFVGLAVTDLDAAASWLVERRLTGPDPTTGRGGPAFGLTAPWGQRLVLIDEASFFGKTHETEPWLPGRPGTWRRDFTVPNPARRNSPAAPAAIPTLTGTCTCGFNVGDLDRAEAFFNRLGFERIRRTGDSPIAAAVYPAGARVEQLDVRCGNSNLTLVEAEVDGRPVFEPEAARLVAHPTWYVPEMNQAMESLRELGVETDSLVAEMFGAEAGEGARYLHFLQDEQDMEIVSYPNGRDRELTAEVPPWHPGKPGLWIDFG